MVCGGCQDIAKIAPMRPSRKPIRRPPTAPTQLTSEKTKITTPQVTCCSGWVRRLLAQIMIIIPHTIPKMPIIAPMPNAKKVKTAPITATIKPPNRTNIPDMSDNAKAAEGYDSWDINSCCKQPLFNACCLRRQAVICNRGIVITLKNLLFLRLT